MGRIQSLEKNASCVGRACDINIEERMVSIIL
jgi:hypothetical protein